MTAAVRGLDFDMATLSPPGATQSGFFTPESLLAYGVEQESIYRCLLEQFPPGSTHGGRSQAYRTMEAALQCAAWMEVAGVTAARYVGPFTTRRYRRGDRVRLKRGARVHGTGPHIGREGLVLTRAQQITVHDFQEGHVWSDNPRADGDVIRHAQVHWVGAGSYWRWTDANNIEFEAAHESAAGLRRAAIDDDQHQAG